MVQGGPIRGKGWSLSKGDLKDCQLPVTDTTPEVCVAVSTPSFEDIAAFDTVAAAAPDHSVNLQLNKGSL